MEDFESIGIDIGGTNLRIAKISRDGKIYDFYSEKVCRSKDLLIDQIKRITTRYINQNTKGIGIGIPGRVLCSQGIVLSAGYIKLYDVPLGNIIETHFGLPVVIDNDAYMAAYAETSIGAATKQKNVVMFTIGTGIGGAVYLNGKLFYGNGAAGQLGHLTIDMHGSLCNCGRRGCVETLSSGTVLRSYMREADISDDVLLVDLIAAQKNDKRIKELLSKWIRPLRMAIDSTVAVFNPEMIILGGGLGKDICTLIHDYPQESSWFQCSIQPAKFGDNAGVIGAGLRLFNP